MICFKKFKCFVNRLMLSLSEHIILTCMSDIIMFDPRLRMGSDLKDRTQSRSFTLTFLFRQAREEEEEKTI